MSKIHDLYSLQPNVGAAKMNKLKENKTNKRAVLSKTVTWANEIKCTGIIGIDFQHPFPEDPRYPTAGHSRTHVMKMMSIFRLQIQGNRKLIPCSRTF